MIISEDRQTHLAHIIADTIWDDDLVDFVDDELAMSLLEIKNQTEFAKRFGIKDLGTLTEWNKKIEKEGGLLKHINSWARKLTPNVVSALYREATKTGKAAEVKAWMEIVEGM